MKTSLVTMSPYVCLTLHNLRLFCSKIQTNWENGDSNNVHEVTDDYITYCLDCFIVLKSRQIWKMEIHNIHELTDEV